MGRFSAVLKVKLSRRDVGTCLFRIAEEDGEKYGSGLGCGRIAANFLNFNFFCLLILFKKFWASAMGYYVTEPHKSLFYLDSELV